MHLFLICVFDTWALLLGLNGRYFYIVTSRERYRLPIRPYRIICSVSMDRQSIFDTGRESGIGNGITLNHYTSINTVLLRDADPQTEALHIVHVLVMCEAYCLVVARELLLTISGQDHVR